MLVSHSLFNMQRKIRQEKIDDVPVVQRRQVHETVDPIGFTRTRSSYQQVIQAQLIQALTIRADHKYSRWQVPESDSRSLNGQQLMPVQFFGEPVFQSLVQTVNAWTRQEASDQEVNRMKSTSCQQDLSSMNHSYKDMKVKEKKVKIINL